MENFKHLLISISASLLSLSHVVSFEEEKKCDTAKVVNNPTF